MTPNEPRGAHLVGSVPLGDESNVLRTASMALGSHLKRIPDGELGTRTNWIAWQYPVLAKLDGFDEVPAPPDAYVQRPRLQARAGVTSADLDLGPLGYADAARTSYGIFSSLREQGVIPPRM